MYLYGLESVNYVQPRFENMQFAVVMAIYRPNEVAVKAAGQICSKDGIHITWTYQLLYNYFACPNYSSALRTVRQQRTMTSRTDMFLKRASLLINSIRF